MKNFAAFGCETANFERTSVSSVGVVVVRDGKKEHLCFLEHSEPDHYYFVCSRVNDLYREDTEDAPVDESGDNNI